MYTEYTKIAVIIRNKNNLIFLADKTMQELLQTFNEDLCMYKWTNGI